MNLHDGKAARARDVQEVRQEYVLIYPFSQRSDCGCGRRSSPDPFSVDHPCPGFKYCPHRLQSTTVVKWHLSFDRGPPYLTRSDADSRLRGGWEVVFGVAGDQCYPVRDATLLSQRLGILNRTVLQIYPYASCSRGDFQDTDQKLRPATAGIDNCSGEIFGDEVN